MSLGNFSGVLWVNGWPVPPVAMSWSISFVRTFDPKAPFLEEIRDFTLLNFSSVRQILSGPWAAPDPNPTKFCWVFGQCCFHWKGSWKKDISNISDFVGFLRGGGVQGEGVTEESLEKIEEPWGRFLLLFQGVGNHPHLFHCFDGWESQIFQKTSASYHPTHIYRMAHGRKLTNKLLQKEKSESQSDCHPSMHSLLAAS